MADWLALLGATHSLLPECPIFASFRQTTFGSSKLRPVHGKTPTFCRVGVSKFFENGGRWQIRTADPLRVMQVL